MVHIPDNLEPGPLMLAMIKMLLQNCMNASKSDIVTWYNEFKASDTIVPCKTYAQALLTNVNTKVKIFEFVSKCKKVENQSMCFDVEKHNAGRSKAMKAKQVIQQGKNCKHNKITDQGGSVAWAKTTQQKLQDPLVLSNRFQMLHFFVDNQEQEQQTSHESSGSVQSVFSTRKMCRQRNIPKITKVMSLEHKLMTMLSCYWLTRTKTLVGNKNETGLFDGGSQDIISPSYQTWSVADTNTHEPNLEQMLTRNYDLNSIEHENSCSHLFGSNQNKQIPISKHNEQCINQTGGKFGFVPQTDLKLYDGDPVHWEKVPDMI